jgi:ubiquinone/menaquinone biosynthesis C-methylase UbiE
MGRSRWLKAVPNKRHLNLVSSDVLVDQASKPLRRSETALACGRKMEIPLPIESDYPEEILGSDLPPELRVGCAKAYFSANFLARRLFRRRVEIAFGFMSDQQWERGLDAGTGAGFILPALAARCREVDAVDLSPMIKYTQEMLDKRGLRNVKLAQADLAHLPYPDQTFDLAVCLSVIEHIPEPELVLKEMARVLQPNGMLILGYPLENGVLNSLKTLAILELRLRRFIQRQRVMPQGEAWHPHVTDGRGLKPTVERIFRIELQQDIRVVGFPVYRILKVRKGSAEL